MKAGLRGTGESPAPLLRWQGGSRSPGPESGQRETALVGVRINSAHALPTKHKNCTAIMGVSFAGVLALLADRRVQAALSAAALVGLAASAGLAMRAKFAALSAIVTTKQSRIGAFDCTTQQRPGHMPDGVVAASILQPDKSPVFYDSFELRVPLSELPRALRCNAGALLTAYLRHSLPQFSQMPQGWMLRIVAALSGNTHAGAVAPSQIAALNLVPGDTILGAFVVACRETAADGTSARLQMRMRDPWHAAGEQGHAGGALMFAVTLEGAASSGAHDAACSTALFETTTVMWSTDHVHAPMPMSSPLAAWVHALTAMALLVYPTREMADEARGGT